MRRKLLGLFLGVTALVALWVTAVATQSVQCGGSFVPSLNCTISGRWNFTNTTSAANTTTQGPIPFQVGGTDVTGIISRVTDLTNAQMLLLDLVPVTVVPAPGAGYYVSIVRVDVIFNYTAAYVGGSNLRLYWGTGRAAFNAASSAITVSGLLVSVTADTITSVAGVPDNTDPPITNQPVVIQMVSGPNFTGGNAANTVRIVVNYRIVKTGL